MQVECSGGARSGNVSRKMSVYFWLILLTHAFLWSFFPPFFMASFLCDSWEMLVIGQNWVISTHKHPAFQGWAAEIVRQILRGPDWVPYVCSQLAVVLSVYGIWRLARKFLSPPLAMIAALSMLSFYFFQYDSPLYNNRTFLRVFWIYAVLFLWDALATNQKRYWILTGVCLALGLYCKMTMFLLVITILAYMVFDSNGRQYWKTLGPYISTVVCFVLFLPLFVYLVQTDFSCLSYASNRTQVLADSSWHAHLWNPLRFLLSQISFVLLLAIPLLPLLGFRWEFRWKTMWQSMENRFLAFVFLFPIAFQLALIILTGGRCRTALGCHLWLFFTLFALYFCKVHLTRVSWRRSLHLIVFLIFFCFGTWATVEVIRPAFRSEKLPREFFPAEEFASQIESIWKERYSEPLGYVRGDDWLVASASIWGESRPTVYSPLWTTEEDFREKGGVLLWLDESCSEKFRCFDCYNNPDFFYSPETKQPDEWLEQFPEAEFLPPMEFQQRTCFKAPPIRVCVAIVPPREPTVTKNPSPK
ncbi:MAG: glycosyltransferase family 39 protein [Planctomycetia bacterium]|nr:glycosyltransferase family 39 protein [Planctomycetia bacterium]